VAGKRPPASRISHVGKKWVTDFIDFYNLGEKITQRQIDGWSLALARFSDEVLREGWDDFIMQFTPNFVPPIKDANKIFHRAGLRVSERKAKEERDRLREEERVLFRSATGEKRSIAQAVIKALDIKEESATPRKDVNLYLANFWEKEMNDKEMGRKHRMLAKGERVVIHSASRLPTKPQSSELDFFDTRDRFAEVSKTARDDA